MKEKIIKIYRILTGYSESAKDDIYIHMLRYGKKQLKSGNGFSTDNLVAYMRNSGYPSFTEHYTVFKTYSDYMFYAIAKDIYYITPEAYSQLLSYDSMIQSRKEAVLARTIAIWAIIITILTNLIHLI